VTTWRLRLNANPFGTFAAFAAIILGGLGVVIGDDVSAGMTSSLHTVAAPIAHLWGGMFSLGGALKLFGLYTGRSTIEIPGLWLMVGGYGFYSLTVVAGLGMHGLAAGIISGSVTLGCLLKARLIMRAARKVARRSRE
jgi:hypothetical protein